MEFETISSRLIAKVLLSLQTSMKVSRVVRGSTWGLYSRLNSISK